MDTVVGYKIGHFNYVACITGIHIQFDGSISYIMDGHPEAKEEQIFCTYQKIESTK